MLVVTPLSPAAATYFLQGEKPGRWSGGAAEALGLEGPVGAAPLRRVLDGRHPTTGRPLPLRRMAHRRAGWDLTFAAPKSLSLVAALAERTDASAIAGAHQAAVADAMAWLGAHGCRARQAGHLEPVRGILLARYEHGVSDGGDPHLHSHVILANLAFTGGERWSALASSPLWPTMRPLGGVYRLALRERLVEAGLAFGWRPVEAPSGTLPIGGGANAGLRGARTGLVDVDGVPPSAVAVASYRSRDVTSVLSGWEEPELGRRSARRAVRAASRGRSEPDLPGTAPGWESRVGSAGFGSTEAAAICAEARSRAALSRPRQSHELHEAVTEWLRERSTTFTALDVVRALVSTCDAGISPSDLDRWVERFCADPDPYAGAGRWTTPAAERDVVEVLTAAAGSRHEGARDDGCWDLDAGVATALVQSHRLGPQGAAEARRILSGDGGVVVLAGSPGSSRLISQAAILAAARSAWEASGHRVRVLAPTSALRRWEALSALRPPGPGEVPSVLVVDRADRRPSPELRTLIAQAGATGTRLVLVEGGTLPARHQPASGALPELLGARGPGHEAAMAHPGRACAVTVTCHPPAVSGAALACSLGVGTTDAIGALVDRWADTPPGGRPMLVGLGPAEVEALNAEARSRLADRGEVHGPELRADGRVYQAGDRVMALRRLGVGAGTFGTVVAVDSQRARLHVEWPKGTARIDRHDARRIGHGYAATPSRVATTGMELLLLGDPGTVRHLRTSVIAIALVTPTGRRRLPESLDILAARLPPPDPAALATAAAAAVGTLDRDFRRLTARLMAAAPPQPATAARLAEERRQWSPLDRASHAACRSTDLWVQVHAADLASWRLLGAAIDLRGDALARTHEMGGRPLRSGGHPDRMADLAVWRAGLREWDRAPMSRVSPASAELGLGLG